MDSVRKDSLISTSWPTSPPNLRPQKYSVVRLCFLRALFPVLLTTVLYSVLCAQHILFFSNRRAGGSQKRVHFRSWEVPDETS